MKHPKIEIVQKTDDMDKDDIDFLKSIGLEEKDLESTSVQSQMMATAVFLMLTNPDASMEHKKDVFDGWCRFMHCMSQLRAFEKISDMPEKMKTLPEEVRIATAMLVCVERVEKEWQILHNLVTVLMPGDEK